MFLQSFFPARSPSPSHDWLRNDQANPWVQEAYAARVKRNDAPAVTAWVALGQ